MANNIFTIATIVDMDEPKQRQFFIIDNETGKAAATSTAWRTEVNGREAGAVSGLGCLPEYRSKGPGKIAAAYMTDRFHRRMPGVPV